MSSLLGRAFGDVAEVAGWFGAMQAQDLNSILWSLGVRLPGRTLARLAAEMEDRRVVRTWPMRGTVHLVPSADAAWMLDLMGVRVLAGAAKRRESLGLDDRTADRAVEILGAALAGGRRLTRSQCLAALAEGGVAVSGQLGYHLLWYASQRGVTCIAPNIGREQSFVRLDEWAPQPHRPSREEALGIMATRFFRAHGPATRADFARWTGLTMTDTRTAVAAATGLVPVRVDSVEMLADAAALDAPVIPADEWVALPGFDEYMLGYKDRSLMVEAEHLPAIVPGGNGIFQATLVRAGRVVAVWKRTLGRKAVTVLVRPLVPFGRADWDGARRALEPFAAFVELPLIVKNP